jgi:hypothetical protein
MNQNNSREELKKHCWIDEHGDEQMPLDEVVAVLHQELQKVREEMRQETMRAVMSKLRNQFNSEDDELSLEEVEVALYELDQSELDQLTPDLVSIENPKRTNLPIQSELDQPLPDKQ